MPPTLPTNITKLLLNIAFIFFLFPIAGSCEKPRAGLPIENQDGCTVFCHYCTTPNSTVPDKHLPYTWFLPTYRARIWLNDVYFFVVFQRLLSQLRRTVTEFQISEGTQVYRATLLSLVSFWCKKKRRRKKVKKKVKSKDQVKIKRK